MVVRRRDMDQSQIRADGAQRVQAASLSFVVSRKMLLHHTVVFKDFLKARCWREVVHNTQKMVL